MYTVIPFKSIGPYILGMSQQYIESVEGKEASHQTVIDKHLVSVKHLGVNIDYKNGVSAFIGLPTYDGVMMDNKIIKEQSFIEIFNFLASKSASFYGEGGSLFVAKDIGVTCYFEDERVREIGILSESYLEEYLIGMEIVKF